jgi:hypothetical protein
MSSTGGVFEPLSWFHGATGDAPRLVIASLLEQDSPPVIPNEGLARVAAAVLGHASTPTAAATNGSSPTSARMCFT